MAVSQVPDQAFILAAGKGERMRPLTDTLPKPLIPYRGKPIIDHALDKLQKIGVTRVVINLHYLGDMIKAHCQGRDDIEILFSEEEDLLETGGGLKKGLKLLEGKPTYIVNGDGPWEDFQHVPHAMDRLTAQWDPAKMDILILLQPVKRMSLTSGVGDYTILENGQAKRSKDQSGTHMFTGVRILSPKIFEGTPDGPFSFLDLMDRAESQGRLYGLEHDGDWHHLSTPEDVARVNAHYK